MFDREILNSVMSFFMPRSIKKEKKSSLVYYSLDMKVREKNRKFKNSSTVIPSFATFDRVPLFHFLCRFQ